MKNMNMKKLNKFIATMLIISMIFTSGGMASFANMELGGVEPLETSSFIDEETNVGETISFPEEGREDHAPTEIEEEEANNVEEAESNVEEPEETNAGEATSFPEEDIEEPEEYIVEEEEDIAVEKKSEEEESTGEDESTAEEDESNVGEATSFPEEESEGRQIDASTEAEEGREDHAPTASESEIEIVKESEEENSFNISTSSEIEEKYNDEIATESEIDLEVEEKIVDDSILGAGPRSVVFQLPKDLVEEGTIPDNLGGNYTRSEDGTTYTQDFGWGHGTETRFVSLPSFMPQSQNPGLTFNGEWTSGSQTYRGSAQVTFTDSNPTITFTPKITDNRKRLTLKIEQKDWKYASFSEVQDAQYPKKVEYKGPGEITTKFYDAYTPVLNKPDERYVVSFGGSDFGHIENRQDTTQTANVYIGHYKVIYTIPQVQQDLTKMKMYIPGRSGESGKTKYEQDIVRDDKKFTLAKFKTDDFDYKRKLDCWVNDDTGEEYQPGEYTHTGIKHLRVTARVRDYEPVQVSYRAKYVIVDGEEYPEKGTTIPTPSVTNITGTNFRYWYIDDINVPVDFNTYVFNEDTTIFGVVDEIEYPVTYNTNGGKFVDGYEVPKSHTYFTELILPTPSEITKDFATFDGWYQTDDFSGERIYKIPRYTTNSYTLYAKWKEKEYSITYNLNGGNVVSSYDLITNRTYSTGVTLPTGAQLEKIGSGFDGWYESSDFSGSAITEIPANTDRDIVLYAKWVERDYIINYNYNGGTLIDGYTPATQRKYGDLVWLPKNTQVKKQGYSFGGWYQNPEFNGNPIEVISSDAIRDYDLYLLWSENSYNISVNLKGGTLKNGASIKQMRRYTEEVALPTSSQIERTGYTFLGWKVIRNDNYTTISNDATIIPANIDSIVGVEAKWQENEYTITYNENGGTYANGYQKITKRRYSDSASLPNGDQLTKIGYNLAGWYDNPEFNGTAITTIPSDTAADKILYAKWTEKIYSITYNLNGGSVVNVSDMVLNRSYTTSVTLLTGSQVEKIGSGFDGWYESSDFSGSAITVIPANTDRDIVLYAKWIERDYIITYNTNGGTFVNGYSVITSRKYGDYINLPTEEDIKKEGFIFKGWYTNSNFSGNKITFIDSEAIRDYDLYLMWSENTYTITVSNSGSLNEGVSIKNNRLYSEEVVLPTSDQISREGYTFKGWELKRSDNNEVISDNAVKIEAKTAYNVKVTSKWTENSYNVTYYDYGATYTTGFTKPTKRNYTDGIVLPSETGVTKTGYSFGGWYANSEFTGSPITSIPGFNTNDAVVYLKWIENEYSITYNENGGTFKEGYTKPTSRKYTAATTLPTGNDISKPGYTFAGWYENAELTGATIYTVVANTASNKNYYAKWTPRQYNVIYHEDGGVYRNGYTKVTKRNYDEAVTLPTSTDIMKDGGTFIGWYDNNSFTGDMITAIPAYTDKDVHVYVKWNEAIFNITYNENGGIYKEGYTKKTQRRYSDPVYLPQNGDIIKKGFIFGGWYENSSFTGAAISSIPAKTNRDVVLYAKWVDGVYTITYNENGGTYINGYQKITSRKYTDEVKLPTKENLIKEGFDLEGWYESPEFRGSALTKISANTDTNKVLYAKWKGKQFNVTLNTNGGKIHYGNVKKYSHSIGAILPTAVIPPDEHKKFVGWYENENLTGSKVERIDPSSMGDKVYYAKYNPVYLLKFNAGGGIGTMSNIQVEYGKSVNIPNNSFVKEGYKFKNWISNEGKTYEANKSITLNADTILTAEWEKIDNSNPSSGGTSDPGSGDSGSGGSSDSGSGDSGSGNSGSGNSGSGNSGSGSSSGKTGGKTGGNTGGGTSGGSGGSGGGSGGGGGNSGGASSGGPGSVNPGATVGPNNSGTNEKGETVPNVPTGPNSNFNVSQDNNSIQSKPKSNINSDILKQIEDGTAKPGMYYAWEGQAPKWKAKDIVTNEYVKNTFIYAEYAGKVRKYFFNELGEMTVGWINYNGYIYYMNPTEGINYGDMVTGVQYVDGKLCEFLPSGEFYRVIYEV